MPSAVWYSSAKGGTDLQATTARCLSLIGLLGAISLPIGHPCQCFLDLSTALLPTLADLYLRRVFRGVFSFVSPFFLVLLSHDLYFGGLGSKMTKKINKSKIQ